MKSNKLIIIFLIKFFGTYAILFILYSFYLDKTQQSGEIYSCAPITKTVANQAAWLLNQVGYTAETEQNSYEMSVRFIVDGDYIARVNEGCNAISVIILFISFIVAFSSKFVPTLLYILFGSLIIYVTNILRVAVISIAMYKYPEYQDKLHDLVFPTIIYGITFLLWFIWVRFFLKPKNE